MRADGLGTSSEDVHRLTLRDGRILAWASWGASHGRPLLRLQGTPGSRLSVHPDPDLWSTLGLRVIEADRPGFGCSTRLPGRGLAVVADDLVELLDHLGLGRVDVLGVSGGGPHALAMAARHPSRVNMTSILSGVAPIQEDEASGLIELNAEVYRRSRRGWSAVFELLDAERESLLAAPYITFMRWMGRSPEADQQVLRDSSWREPLEGIVEALRPGAQGWADEVMAQYGRWDVDVAQVTRPVEWWHSPDDANTPFTAVVRLVSEMHSVQLKPIERSGHLSRDQEAELLQGVVEQAFRRM